MEDFSLSFAQITQKAAIACYPSIGKKDSMAADQLAVSSMRDSFNQLPMDINIVIGEGERDKAPRLYTGEQLGDKNSNLKWDVAVDPLEGTTLCAEAWPGALSVIAVAPRKYLFKAPDIYMKKIACGPKARNCIDLNAPVKDNISKVAKALGKQTKEITVGVLDRPRHQDLIQQVQSTQANVKLVGDGDIALSLQTILDSAPLDLLMGTGGAPEGVLSAVALKCLGGDFQGQLVYTNEQEREKTRQAGVQDLDKVWLRDELVQHSNCFFLATGVTTGPLLKGVKKDSNFYFSYTLMLSSQGKVELKQKHHLDGSLVW